MAILPGHGTGHDRALEPAAHAEILAVHELLDQRHRLAKVVRAVGVGHDDETAAGRDNPTDQGVAIALVHDHDNTGAEPLGLGPAAVGAAVVGDDHLAAQPVSGVQGRQRLLSLGDAGRQGGHLVEAGHDDRDVDGLGIRHVTRAADFLARLGEIGWKKA